MLKKVTLLSTLLFITAISLARYHPINEKYTPYFQTSDKDKWEVEGQSLFTKSSNTDFNNYPYSPNWGWGFKIKGQYDLQKGKQFSLSWLNFSKNEATSEEVITNIFSEGETQIEATFKESLNIVNFDLNQLFDFHNNVLLIFQGGLQYFKYTRNLSLSFISPISQSELSSNGIYSYQGVGPRIGVQLELALLTRLHLVLGGAYSSIFARTGSKTFDKHMVDRTGPQAINNSWKVTIKENGPIGGEDGNIGLAYNTRILQGHLVLQCSFMGIAFDVDDTKYEMFTLGAKWRGDI